MIFLLSIFALILGSALGSFANVVVIRLKEKETLWGRSHCIHCHKNLCTTDLVPIFSWVCLGGRCRMCRKSIHWQYPVVEFVMAILTLIAVLRHAFDGPMGAWVIGFEVLLSFILVVITAFDLRWKLVPMEFVLGSTILLAAYRILLGFPVLQLVLGALVIGILLGMLVFASRGMMMGEGDPFVGLLMGAVLGFPLSLLGLLIAFIIGGSVAAALLIERVVTRKTEVAFVPFLAAGTLIAFWWSQPLEVLLRYAIG